ncbi:FAD-dependent oxidoreductase [Paenibacillus albiflavus]|uniref:FAD-dependent oxidoreductase n=1 Tax=Paenibacillus albiflavus TaxID=2545760 RepID=A0A4R4EDF4_9BACL|nr:FAD-dependent oxidoreductase [Paenibacillus albiflavus]TCZ77243.1 FAD-dependent oxidoreductase [Paenibacillus albiflavus]
MAHQSKSFNGKQSKSWLILMSVLIIITVLAAVAALYYQNKHPHKIAEPQVLEKVTSSETIADQYDVVVVGTDPEGIAAAVSASRNGLKTLLVDGNNREILGGLFTLGWLNTIDMNWKPGGNGITGQVPLNKGIFSEMFGQIEGDSFDVITAANVFNRMVKNEKNIDLLLQVQAIEPLMKAEAGANGNKVIEGVNVTLHDGTKKTIKSKSVIDASQDADLAVAAGVPYTYGREDLVGDTKTKMAVTLVFRLKNVTPEVWKNIKDKLNNDDSKDTGANDVSAWGYFEMYQYPSSNPERVKMRGLNIGRQNNETMLINALQIFGIDGSDPKSREEAFEIGMKEVPLVVEYMKTHFPEFAGLELDVTAPELYVRETRHTEGEYRLNILDVLENKDQWDRIAFGSYEVDIQNSSAAGDGTVVGKTDQYAIPFRSIVPLQVDNLLVVGRAASFDTLPHGSARTVPVGMGTGEAAGAAAKIAQDANITFRELSASKELIAKLQEQLNKQGMDINPFTIEPYAYMKDPQYEGLRVALAYGLEYLGYKKEYDYSKKSNPVRMANLISGVKRIKADAVKADPSKAVKGDLKEAAKLPLTLEQASYTIALGLGVQVNSPSEAQAALIKAGIVKEATFTAVKDMNNLTNGEMFMMLKDIKVSLIGE